MHHVCDGLVEGRLAGVALQPGVQMLLLLVAELSERVSQLLLILERLILMQNTQLVVVVLRDHLSQRGTSTASRETLLGVLEREYETC
jgi:hypothetical protein